MPDSTLHLSYVLTTYNRLPTFRLVLERLLAHVSTNEEIVVCDGGSTDGTADYVAALYKAGKVHQFSSTPDKGEAHGFNRALLRARGELIKLISDDDAFHYPTIRACRDFMLAQPSISVLYGETGLVDLENLETLRFYDDAAANFRHWSATGQPVWLIGLTTMIRRDALAMTGLFKTGIIQADSEFALRITRLNLRLAWCLGLGAIRIENEKSNFRNMRQKRLSEDEFDRMNFFYNPVVQHTMSYYIWNRSGIKEALKKPLRVPRDLLLQWLGRQVPVPHIMQAANSVGPNATFAEALAICDAYFEAHQKSQSLQFLVHPTL